MNYGVTIWGNMEENEYKEIVEEAVNNVLSDYVEKGTSSADCEKMSKKIANAHE